ncbi:MAG TPA: transglutaminase-like domain-containing protein, partial [Pirellulaceae bacterium]
MAALTICRGSRFVTSVSCLILATATGALGQTSNLVPPLRFNNEPWQSSRSFQWNDPTSPYLTRLRTEFKLDQVVAGRTSDYRRTQAVCHWVRGRWEHNGSNEPRRPDPISILQEATEGRQFRCVEYAIVLSGALSSLGIPARVVGLMTEDAETRTSGAGHVVAEAYLPDRQRWIMCDGQWDVIPLLDGKPLSALGLQEALADRAPGLSVYSVAQTEP